MDLLSRISVSALVNCPTFRYIAFSLCFALMQLPCIASEKTQAFLHSVEGMKEHNSGEPLRLMQDTLLTEFNKGKVFELIDFDRSARPAKNPSTLYHVGASLVAFSYSPKLPTRVSISLQLLNSHGKVEMTADKAFDIDGKLIDSCLKLHKPEFDRSTYGKALVELCKVSCKAFEEKFEQMNLRKSAQN